MPHTPCEYPGCQCTGTGLHPWLPGIKYTCENHDNYLKITDDVKYFGNTCHESWNCQACSIKDRSGIWYTKRHCGRIEPNFIDDLLYIDKNCIINYYKLYESDPVYMWVYVPDIHSDWYVKVDICGLNDVIFSYTYKSRLYEMRILELYFGAIPKDVLDEVIKYL